MGREVNWSANAFYYREPSEFLLRDEQYCNVSLNFSILSLPNLAIAAHVWTHVFRICSRASSRNSGFRVCARETFDRTGVPMCALPLKRPVENWFCHPRATSGNEMARQIARSCKHSPASRASAACPPDAPPAGVVSRVDSDTCHGFGNSSRAHFVDTRFEDARPRVGLASNLRSRVLKAFDPLGTPSE